MMSTWMLHICRVTSRAVLGSNASTNSMLNYSIEWDVLHHDPKTPPAAKGRFCKSAPWNPAKLLSKVDIGRVFWYNVGEMKRTIKRFFLLSFLLIGFGVFLFLLSHWRDGGDDTPVNAVNPEKTALAQNWAAFSGGREGKVVYAQPPFLYVLDLQTGVSKKVPRVVVDGAKGRRNRGKTPRPSWAPGGKWFSYRYNGHIFVCNEKGKRKAIQNDLMDASHETRWTWRSEDGEGWLVGPSKDKHVIMVKISDPSVVKTVFSGGKVDKHCDMTNDGYIVYDNGSDIFVAPRNSTTEGIEISSRQSCRPCAAPNNRVAWLPAPHVRYDIHDAVTGRFIKALKAPDGEELYRLNWSNFPDFAAHMYGSRGNTRMHVRKISTGEYLFIGYGWDPDLWVGRDEKRGIRDQG